MTKKTIKWTPDTTYPVGKGATEQRFTATVGDDELEIDTHPWGDAELKIDGKTVAHVEGDKSAGDAFRDIEEAAEKFEAEKDKISTPED
ncbi:hypothetical protein [Lentibacter sp. XHP0401]|uniref:hypothetical protein n=1 Tax=Lentibacter sp. XHP0401 TaxID=2984334 RepID=UPI0021E8A90F|nr:hypothetical protein [Lentibacter sp. XHP0401]MCV2892077.1 hypothetical protein [Lentibacter sp. XHP0401]